MNMNILDLFSGIGGFSQGLKQAGFNIKKHYYAEVDKHAQAIYKNRFSNAQAVGDVRHVRGSELGRIHAITFGSPCQDFSLAGKRRGMDGERSSLITEAIRLIDECRPDFFIWENVKGTFSSNNGADFWAIIQAFANLGGYRIEWQPLNTAWFLPQNRERIYLVGRLADRCVGEVFPIGENDNRSSEKIRKRRIIRGRNKNTQGCIDTRGGTRSSRADLDNYIYDYDKQTVRMTTPLEHERLNGFEDGWTVLGDSRDTDAKRNFRLGNAVTVDVVEAVGRAIIAGTDFE